MNCFSSLHFWKSSDGKGDSRRARSRFRRWLLAVGLWSLLLVSLGGIAKAAESAAFPPALSSYDDANVEGVFSKLVHRAKKEPFNVVATLLFLAAITHTFLAGKFMALSHRERRAYDALEDRESHPEHGEKVARQRDRLLFRAEVYHFLGEVEAVFGIWGIPLAVAIVCYKDWGTMVRYISGASFAEPVFVVAVMAISSTRPVLRFSEQCLARLAALGGATPGAWWLSILTAGPLLGSFITEPAAMTICALLLKRRFYALQPSAGLRYATLGLLFVNISVGGTLTHFAAPPVVMVAHQWNWGFAHMFIHFGWKAATGIVAASIVYFVIFRKEWRALAERATLPARKERPIPWPVTVAHLLFIAWTVLVSHHAPLVILGLLFFLAFVEAAARHQQPVNLRGSLLVGFFLAALVIHGGCQQWWIAPVLSSLGKWPLMVGATLLTAVNDNAAITYLASLVPGFSDGLKYAVVAGAVTGGGLTVIANAPNPAGQSILNGEFGEDGISPLKLLVSAIPPTLIMGAAFMLLP
jgi:hypothetical protein